MTTGGSLPTLLILLELCCLRSRFWILCWYVHLSLWFLFVFSLFFHPRCRNCCSQCCSLLCLRSCFWILYWSVFSLFFHPRCDNCLCCSHWCYLCCSRLWFLCWYMHLSSFVIHVAILFLSVCLFVVVYQPWNHLFHSCLHLPDIYCARRFAGVTPFHIWSSLRIIDFQLL